MKAILLTVLLICLLLGLLLVARFGVGGPSEDAIRAAVLERLRATIELSEVEFKRTPAFVFQGDQLITYTATAMIKEDYVRRLNPFEWQARCKLDQQGEGNAKLANKSLAGSPVYEVVAKQGAKLTMIGRMRAYLKDSRKDGRKDSRWAFTARNSRLMDGDSRVRRTPVSAINDGVLVSSQQFDQLCEAMAPS